MKIRLVSDLDHPANPEAMDRETQLKQVLRLAVMRDSVPAWENAVAQLGPVTVDLVNSLALPTVCAAYGSLDILGVLKKMGADLGRPGCDGKSPIHVAAENGDAEIVKFLLDAGVPADIRVIDPKNALNLNGSTALHMAAFEAEIEVCKILLAREADPNAVCSRGLTPLYQAMSGVTDDRLTELLLRAGADEQDIVRVWKEHHPESELANAFQIVVRQGMVSTASYYMGELRADPNQLTSKGKTLLQLAKHAGKKAEEMRETILSHRCCAGVIAKASCASSSRPSLSI